jgi:hypothetical protein
MDGVIAASVIIIINKNILMRFIIYLPLENSFESFKHCSLIEV